MAQGAGHDDGRLCGFADRIHFASPRQNGAAAFMDRSVLNDKSALQRKAKGFVSRGLLRINPDDQYTGGTQELHQPIKRNLQSSERAPPPVNQRHAVLAGRMAAVCRGGRASIAAAMQSSNISSTALDPATTIRCCLEQPASAIIGSTMRSPTGAAREWAMTSPF
jgi:hypothetical protein